MDKQKICNFWILCRNIPSMSPKSFQKVYHPKQEINLYLSDFSKKVSQLTDWQAYKKIRIILTKCINIQGMPPKILRKISYPEQEMFLYWPNFSKDVSQLTNWHTYKKFGIIWKYFTNIPEMSMKNFRKISHSELEISLY